MCCCLQLLRCLFGEHTIYPPASDAYTTSVTDIQLRRSNQLDVCFRFFIRLYNEISLENDIQVALSPTYTYESSCSWTTTEASSSASLVYILQTLLEDIPLDDCLEIELDLVAREVHCNRRKCHKNRGGGWTVPKFIRPIKVWTPVRLSQPTARRLL